MGPAALADLGLDGVASVNDMTLFVLGSSCLSHTQTYFLCFFNCFVFHSMNPVCFQCVPPLAHVCCGLSTGSCPDPVVILVLSSPDRGPCSL